MKIFDFFRKTKGSISLFMAIIMMASLVMTSILVDGSRIRSATTLVQAASDSALRSVLADYDIELKDRYGLFTLANSGDVQADYMNYFIANLSASMPGPANSFQNHLNQTLQWLEGQGVTFPGNNLEPGPILDMYDFQKNGDPKVDPVYSIIEPRVFQKQVAEFSKYRSAIVLYDLINSFSDISAAAEKEKEDVANVNKSLEVRGDIEDVMKEVCDWEKDKVKPLEETFNGVIQMDESISLSIYGTAEILYENEDKGYSSELYELYKQHDSAEEDARAGILTQINELKEEIKPWMNKEGTNGETAPLDEIGFGLLQHKNATLQSALEDFKTAAEKIEGFKQYIERCERNVKNSKNDTTDGTDEVREGLHEDYDNMSTQLAQLKATVEKNETWLNACMGKIEARITAIGPMNSEVDKAFRSSTELETEIINQSKAETFKDNCKALYDAAEGFYDSRIQSAGAESPEVYEYQKDPNATNYSEFYNTIKKSKDDFKKPKEETLPPAEITDEQQAVLPSVLYRQDNRYHTNDTFLDADRAFVEAARQEWDNSLPGTTSFQDTEIDFENIDEDNISETLGTFDQFLDVIGNMASAATNGAMTDMYTMSMFRSRITKTTDEWNEVYGNRDKPDEYERWDCKRDQDPEEDLMFRDKGEMGKAEDAKFPTFFDAEIEYIIQGGMSEKANRDWVYTKIYGIRLVNNFIAMYANSTLRNMAISIASFTGPFAPLAQIGIMLVFAIAETYIDMYFLMDMGYRIPLIKTNKNLTLSVEYLNDRIAELAEMDDPDELLVELEPNTTNMVNVNYETYLYLFLLLTSKEDKVLRMADIIQLNMQLGDPNYKLADHYTAVRAESSVTIKPLMVSYPFMPLDMRQDGRFALRTMMYVSY